jgi:16S rRNA (cytosine967-C5)-methyltransferase
LRFVNPGAAVRASAAQALAKIVAGQSRRVAFADVAPIIPDPRDRALLSALLSDGARWWLRFSAAIDGMVERPLRDAEIKALLVLGLVQLEILQLPDYAAVAATVDAARELRKPKLAGFANALLRRWLRERDARLNALDADAVTRAAHPAWLLDAFRAEHADHIDQITAANNAEAPLWLRANARRTSRDVLLKRLRDEDIACDAVDALPDAIVLRDSADVTQLPGYTDGWFSVQDGAAQFAAMLIDPRDGEHILDACAAPGGKTAHLLERAQARVTALDVDASRLARVRDNLDRLGLCAELVAGDAAEPAKWWDGVAFDHILLDAPCSATGIIRRQPDIKLHRRATDIPALAAAQSRILDALWPLLKPGGRLVYATCSILAAENARQIDAFLNRHDDARAQPLPLRWHAAGRGMQNLPGESGMDGFFYAMVEKAT